MQREGERVEYREMGRGDRGGGRERREGGYKEMEKGDGEDKDGQTGVCYIKGCSHMESCETM